MLKEKFDGSWPTGPGIIDPKKPLPDVEKKLELDLTLHGNENSEWK